MNRPNFSPTPISSTCMSIVIGNLGKFIESVNPGFVFFLQVRNSTQNSSNSNERMKPWKDSKGFKRIQKEHHHVSFREGNIHTRSHMHTRTKHKTKKTRQSFVGFKILPDPNINTHCLLLFCLSSITQHLLSPQRIGFELRGSSGVFAVFEYWYTLYITKGTTLQP